MMTALRVLLVLKLFMSHNLFVIWCRKYSIYFNNETVVKSESAQLEHKVVKIRLLHKMLLLCDHLRFCDKHFIIYFSVI